MKLGDIIVEEWEHVFKERRYFSILFLVPLLYVTMFGYLYSSNRVKDLDMVIFDDDNSQLSRQIITAFDQTETFNVTKQVTSDEEVEKTIAKGEAKAGIVIPHNFYTRLQQGENVPVLTLIDGSNMIISNAATKAANEVISTFSYAASSKGLEQKGLRKEQVEKTFFTVPFRYRVLYNPTFNYSNFLVYGLIGTALQQVLFLGVALTVTRESERGTWGRFYAWRYEPWKVAYAKSAPYFLIGIWNVLAAYAIGVYIFHLPFRGTLAPILTLAVLFSFAIIGVGYFASLFSRSQLEATQTTMLIAVPSFLLSGFTWPFEAMPKLLDVVGHCLPLTYFLDGIRKVMLRGEDFTTIWRDCIALFLMGAISYLLAFIWSILPFGWKKHKIDQEEERLS